MWCFELKCEGTTTSFFLSKRFGDVGDYHELTISDKNLRTCGFFTSYIIMNNW